MKRILPILLLLLAMASCSVKQGVPPRRYQTLQEKATVTLQMDQHQYTMSCMVQVWRNELIIMSVQPMLGIEMIRVEAGKDSVVIFDKLNRRYTSIMYADVAKHIEPAPSFKMLQDFLTDVHRAPTTASSELQLQVGEHRINVACKYLQREYDILKEPKQLDTKRYKRVSLHEIIPL